MRADRHQFISPDRRVNKKNKIKQHMLLIPILCNLPAQPPRPFPSHTMPNVLPNFMRSPNRPWRSHSLIGVLRQHRWLLISILFFVLYTMFGHGTRQCLKCAISGPPSDEPPTWKRLKKWEDDLPQHNLDLPLPEGRHGRYVLFKNQVQQLGWNNQLNEV